MDVRGLQGWKVSVETSLFSHHSPYTKRLSNRHNSRFTNRCWLRGEAHDSRRSEAKCAASPSHEAKCTYTGVCWHGGCQGQMSCRRNRASQRTCAQNPRQHDGGSCIRHVYWRVRESACHHTCRLVRNNAALTPSLPPLALLENAVVFNIEVVVEDVLLVTPRTCKQPCIPRTVTVARVPYSQGHDPSSLRMVVNVSIITLQSHIRFGKRNL